jgi:antitoxin HicB
LSVRTVQLETVTDRGRQPLAQERGEEEAVPEQRAPETELNLPYPVTLVRGEPGVADEWLASVDALAGCSATAATPEEALEGVSKAVAEWLEAAEREGRDIPDQKSLQSHSGRLLLRMPQTLHAELSRMAEKERVSLNQFITDVLAGTLGWRVPARGSRIATRPVDPVAPGANGRKEVPTEASDEPEALAPQRSTNLVTVALIANFVLVALAAVVAIIVFVAVWL